MVNQTRTVVLPTLINARGKKFRISRQIASTWKIVVCVMSEIVHTSAAWNASKSSPHINQLILEANVNLAKDSVDHRIMSDEGGSNGGAGGDDLSGLSGFFFYVFIVHPATAWILRPGRFEKKKSIMYAIGFLALLATVKTGMFYIAYPTPQKNYPMLNYRHFFSCDHC